MTTILNGRIEVERTQDNGIIIYDLSKHEYVYIDTTQCELLVKFLRDNKIVE